MKPHLEPATLQTDLDSSQVGAVTIKECMNALRGMPHDAALAIPKQHETLIREYPIPTAQDGASDGSHLTLHVDRTSQTAWVTMSGGFAGHLHETLGPWPATNPNVKRLLELIEARSSTPN